MNLIIRWLLLACALVLLAQWNIGLHVASYSAALWAALVIGLLNAFVRPLLIVLTLPITFITMGLFLFVINALMFKLASNMLSGFEVDGFWPSVLAAFLYSCWGLVIDAAMQRLFVRRGGPPLQ